MPPIVAGIQTQAGSGLNFPWREYVGKTGSMADASFGHDGSAIGMSIIINWADMEQAIQSLLGYSYREVFNASKFRIRRVLPWRHPRFEQMWCTRITSVKGHKIKTKRAFFPNRSVTDVPSGGPLSDYEYGILALQFTRPRYAVLSDIEVGWTADAVENNQEEYRRFIDRFWTPTAQILSREGTTFKFSPGVMPAGQPFPGSVGYRLGKMKLSRKWHQVPELAIYDSSGFPRNLFFDVGAKLGTILSTVNKTTFFGCPPGTLLYLGCDITPMPLPMPPRLMELVGESRYQQYDVTLHFEYFDPPRGYLKNPDDTPGAQISEFATINGEAAWERRGHNLMPWSKDGRWYPIESQATTIPLADRRPLQAYEFANLFKCL